MPSGTRHVTEVDDVNQLEIIIGTLRKASREKCTVTTARLQTTLQQDRPDPSPSPPGMSHLLCLTPSNQSATLGEPWQRLDLRR